MASKPLHCLETCFLAVYSPAAPGTLFSTCSLCGCLWVLSFSVSYEPASGSGVALPARPKGIFWKLCPLSKESGWRSLFYNAHSYFPSEIPI